MEKRSGILNLFICQGCRPGSGQFPAGEKKEGEGKESGKNPPAGKRCFLQGGEQPCQMSEIVVTGYSLKEMGETQPDGVGFQAVFHFDGSFVFQKQLIGEIKQETKGKLHGMIIFLIMLINAGKDGFAASRVCSRFMSKSDRLVLCIAGGVPGVIIIFAYEFI